jgi:ADP-heptose:LPS heptosyltransferase
MRILIIHSFGIGDMIMSTPTLKEIKTKYPDSIIDFLIRKKLYDISSIYTSGANPIKASIHFFLTLNFE